MAELNFPTETIDLPSKGLVYPKDHPLSSGKVEMKYMTTREEDILTNINYLDKNIILDKLLESMTLNKFDVKDIIDGDKNALLISSRILGYGKDYIFKYKEKEYTIDLSLLENKPFNEEDLTPEGTLKFVLPYSENEVELKFLTEKEQDEIEVETKALQKIDKNRGEVSVRLRHTIVSVNGDKNKDNIRNFVDNHLLAKDARELRNFIKSKAPDINSVFVADGNEEVPIPITLAFFWPDFQGFDSKI